jgi:hypothetical protein
MVGGSISPASAVLPYSASRSAPAPRYGSPGAHELAPPGESWMSLFYRVAYRLGITPWEEPFDVSGLPRPLRNVDPRVYRLRRGRD